MMAFCNPLAATKKFLSRNRQQKYGSARSHNVARRKLSSAERAIEAGGMRFRMDELKVHREFVTHVARGGRDGAVAAAIIALGRKLGMQVVAEGVETQAQSAFLLARECNLQQGFLFSAAVPARDFEQLLRMGSIVPSCAPANPVTELLTQRA